MRAKQRKPALGVTQQLPVRSQRSPDLVELVSIVSKNQGKERRASEQCHNALFSQSLPEPANEGVPNTRPEKSGLLVHKVDVEEGPSSAQDGA